MHADAGLVYEHFKNYISPSVLKHWFFYIKTINLKQVKDPL